MKFNGPLLWEELFRQFGNEESAIRKESSSWRAHKLESMSEFEQIIFHLTSVIDCGPAHPLLTECVVKLGDARVALAKWIDEKCAERGRSET